MNIIVSTRSQFVLDEIKEYFAGEPIKTVHGVSFPKTAPARQSSVDRLIKMAVSRSRKIRQNNPHAVAIGIAHGWVTPKQKNPSIKMYAAVAHIPSVDVGNDFQICQVQIGIQMPASFMTTFGKVSMTEPNMLSKSYSSEGWDYNFDISNDPIDPKLILRNSILPLLSHIS